MKVGRKVRSLQNNLRKYPMKKIKIQCHSVLRYGISKILVASTLVLISANAFADMSDCVNATKAESWNKAIEKCKPLISENSDALGILAKGTNQSEKTRYNLVFNAMKGFEEL